jgi:hypothetical protein
MEAVFRSGISRIFLDDFLTDPAGKYWNLLESTDKNPGIPDRNTASNFLVISVASRPFPAVCHSPGFTCPLYDENKNEADEICNFFVQNQGDSLSSEELQMF